MARGVICSPEQIVIGAGVQSLLQILIDILQPDITSIALEAPGFAQAERLFTSHGWQVRHFSTDQLETSLPRLLYVSPSNPYKGRSLSPQQRLNLLRWATQQQTYLLEDDYNGEFRYFGRPVSSLQGMSDGRTVIYLGSFSRLLLPSLRISYMVLPPLLLDRYRQLGHLYNQTSSTIEQLALADFIAAGALRRHVKRLRRLYSNKNTLLRQALTEIFGSRVIVRAYESGLHLRLAVVTQQTADTLSERALENGVRILPVYDSNGNLPEILLSFVGIQEKRHPTGTAAIKKSMVLVSAKLLTVLTCRCYAKKKSEAVRRHKGVHHHGCSFLWRLFYFSSRRVPYANQRSTNQHRCRQHLVAIIGAAGF